MNFFSFFDFSSLVMLYLFFVRYFFNMEDYSSHITYGKKLKLFSLSVDDPRYFKSFKQLLIIIIIIIITYI